MHERCTKSQPLRRTSMSRRRCACSAARPCCEDTLSSRDATWGWTREWGERSEFGRGAVSVLSGRARREQASSSHPPTPEHSPLPPLSPAPAPRPAPRLAPPCPAPAPCWTPAAARPPRSAPCRGRGGKGRAVLVKAAQVGTRARPGYLAGPSAAAVLPDRPLVPHLLPPSAAPSRCDSSDTCASRPYFCSRSARASRSASAARAVAASSCSRSLPSSSERSLRAGGG